MTAFSIPDAQPGAAPIGEILWDIWGVPHIFADSVEALGFAFGWAQMQSHGNTILRVYGEARGRAAEYWGEQHVASDRLVRTMDIPAQGIAGYHAQDPEFRRYLDAFIAGANAFAERHPDRLDQESRQVLPVAGSDVLAHAHRLFFVLHAGQAGRPLLVGPDGYPSPALTGSFADSATSVYAGSNAWAIGPRRSSSGHAMLLVNLHLPWSVPLFTLFEAQLVGPGLDFYGATVAGLPVPIVGFNDQLGWAHTVNTFDALDTYELRLADEGYVFDGDMRPFETESQTIKVKQADQRIREEPCTIRRSIHGPVVTLDGKSLAVRFVGHDRHGALKQWWDMSQARSLAEFERALQRLELTMLTVMYADRAGNIMHLFGGRMPRRPMGDASTWAAPVAGDSSATLWSESHSYADLPKAMGSECDWLQNSNCPPWRTAVPSPLRKTDFPDYMAPDFVSAREQRAVRMLSEAEHLSFDDLVRCRYSTRVELADRVLDDLIQAARASDTPSVAVLANVLAAWDRATDAESRGALLFATWATEMFPDSLATADVFAVPWNPENSFATPRGLADPVRAVAALKRAAMMIMLAGFPGVDVPWGDVMRLRRNGADLPGNGASGDPLGVFHVVDYSQCEATRFEATGGDSFVAAVEFADPIRAEVLLGCGNSSDPNTGHFGDQLQLLSRKQMRRVWRTRADIEAHLESREITSSGAARGLRAPRLPDS